jgi:hypothetical protein
MRQKGTSMKTNVIVTKKNENHFLAAHFPLHGKNLIQDRRSFGSKYLAIEVRAIRQEEAQWRL